MEDEEQVIENDEEIMEEETQVNTNTELIDSLEINIDKLIELLEKNKDKIKEEIEDKDKLGEFLVKVYTGSNQLWDQIKMSYRLDDLQLSPSVDKDSISKVGGGKKSKTQKKQYKNKTQKKH